MPVQSVDVRAGDPTQQASGQWRGTVDVTLTDGRVYMRNLRAETLDEWNDLVANAGAETLAEVSMQDAAEAVEDVDIVASKEATVAQTCRAYIEQAMATEQAYDAWLLLARINTYVTNNGGWAVAKPALLAVGLEEDVFDSAQSAYNYLSGGGRPNAMSTARTIQENWESNQ